MKVRHLIVLAAAMWLTGAHVRAGQPVAPPGRVVHVAARTEAGAGLGFLSGQALAAATNPIASSPDSVAAGKQLYTRNCAPCHGTSGEGGPGNDLIPAAPDLTDAMWDHGASDGEIFTSIKDGIPPDFNMTPFKDRLKDDDIWNVVNYLRSIAKHS